MWSFGLVLVADSLCGLERNAYHGGVKFVEYPPLLLFHDIDLLIVKNLPLGQVADDGFRIVAK